MEREVAKEKRLSEQLETLPEWALEPPKADGNGFYGVGIARSESMSAAMDKAGLKADFELAKQVRQRVSGLSKDYTADNGSTGTIDERFEQAVERLVLPVNMAGQQVVKQEMRVVDGEFSAVVLKQLSFDRMEQMLAKHQSVAGVGAMSSAFEELRARIEATE
ncbi:hypothetical protein [Vreelandella utahensis]|uniref:hypothetical protein n=1 Tax=Vreelandella halophila TaxID=86177 RepID=UPI001CA96CD2|nr:hypothetical protein [Halomonas utahensis]